MIPTEIRRKMEAIMFAKAYNHYTGATITHEDVENMSFMEAYFVEQAILAIRNTRND